MNRKAVAIILMIVGGAIFLGVLLFVLDRATSVEPDGLGTWIFALLGFLLSVATGIKGWLDFNKKETHAPSTTITAGADSQVASGPNSRQVQLKEGPYIEHTEKVEIHYPEKAALTPLHQLPHPPADFTGREQIITQLLKDFKTRKGATISGLTGMGGVGKTALGLVVAHEVAKDYPDAQIFLDLKGTTKPLSAADVLRHVIVSFEPGMDVRTEDIEQLASACRSVLHGKRVLLFLDNARSAEQLMQPPDTCALLVTSRWNFGVPGLRHHRLSVMDAQEAENFLLELCPRVGEFAGEIAKVCGYLPLALRIAGSFLGVNPDWRVDEYLAQLSDRKQRLSTLQENREEAGLMAEPDLLAAFELSYNQLEEVEQKQWRMLGVFPTSFAMETAGALWELEEKDTRKLLSLYGRYSLLDYDETTARYSIHDLLAEYACSLMNPEEEYAARLKHASHYKDVLAAADDLYLEGGENVLLGLRLLDLEWDNIRAGQAWATSVPQKHSGVAELCIAYPDAGVYVLDLRQHPRERIQWLEAAVSAAREIGNQKSEGYALINLGNAYADLGDARKAIEYYEQALVITLEIGERPTEGIAHNNLGNRYRELGDARKAIEYFEQALVINREISNRRGEGETLNNLGLAYSDLGEVRKAIEYYEQALIIHSEIGDRRVEGAALSNLGSAYADLGDSHEAIEYYEQALIIAREIGDRRGEAFRNWNLGLVYEKAGELEKAIDVMQLCVDFEREIGHPNVEKDAAAVEKLRRKLAGQSPAT